MLAVVLNAARMLVIRDTYRGTLVFANVVAFICILVAFIRAENERKES